MDSDSGGYNPKAKHAISSRRTFWLAYQSLGVVYGDLSTSPIYVYGNIFSGNNRVYDEDGEVIGVLSLILWTMILISLIKYIIIVLGADDNGEGGIFALYSRLCRNSKIGLINTPKVAHESLPVYEFKSVAHEKSRSSLMINSFFEEHQISRLILFFIVLLGTSMCIADGILTPSMSVLSAVSGLKVKAPELHETYTLIMACVILVFLFTLQKFGTHRVGFLFAPVLISWLGFLSVIGVYNIWKWNPGVVRALSPYYGYNFLKVAGKKDWTSLGSIVLCITGSEAMFADLGHFSKLSLRIAFSLLVFPSLLLAYMGEAAFISTHKEDLQMTFFRSIPESIFWPVYVIATLATIVGSQAAISATFSLISQCASLNCFPPVKIIHTSNHVHGQIYIPEINWILMLLCLSVTIGFRDTELIGNAFVLAVITVMFVTTCLMFLIIATVWNRSILLASLFTIIFGAVELLYLLACLTNVSYGGWFPLVLSLFILSIMAAWHYGQSRKLSFELENSVQLDSILSCGSDLGIVRVPGIGLIFSSTPGGIPPMFSHFITNFPAIHRIIIFVSIQILAVPKVPLEDRFLITVVGPRDSGFFGCIVRFGYKDARDDACEFEDQLLKKVAEHLLHDVSKKAAKRTASAIDWRSDVLVDDISTCSESNEDREEPVREEVRDLLVQREAGVAYMTGHTCVKSHSSSSFLKIVAIDLVYGFLRRNCRRAMTVGLGLPHASLIQVGIVYQV